MKIRKQGIHVPWVYLYEDGTWHVNKKKAMVVTSRKKAARLAREHNAEVYYEENS